MSLSKEGSKFIACSRCQFISYLDSRRLIFIAHEKLHSCSILLPQITHMENLSTVRESRITHENLGCVYPKHACYSMKKKTKNNSRLLNGTHNSRVRKQMVDDTVHNIKIESYDNHKGVRSCHPQIVAAPCHREKVYSNSPPTKYPTINNTCYNLPFVSSFSSVDIFYSADLHCDPRPPRDVSCAQYALRSPRCFPVSQQPRRPMIHTVTRESMPCLFHIL